MEKNHYDLTEDEEIGPYIFFPLYADDIGERNQAVRSARPEFINRRPACIQSLTPQGATLRIVNSGLMPSDLIRIDYQLVFCTATWHGAADGFTTSHAGEINGTSLDDYTTIDFIKAEGHFDWSITFPVARLIGNLVNIYLRVKVSTLWEPIVPENQWDFANDVTVVECHLPLFP